MHCLNPNFPANNSDQIILTIEKYLENLGDNYYRFPKVF